MLAWAVENHVAVVPFGGGTCVTGGLSAGRAGLPVAADAAARIEVQPGALGLLRAAP